MSSTIFLQSPSYPFIAFFHHSLRNSPRETMVDNQRFTSEPSGVFCFLDLQNFFLFHLYYKHHKNVVRNALSCRGSFVFATTIDRMCKEEYYMNKNHEEIYNFLHSFHQMNETIFCEKLNVCFCIIHMNIKQKC